MNRGFALLFIPLVVVALTLARTTRRDRPKACEQERIAWVTSSLQRMQSIQPGMTRHALSDVFTTEGGLSTGLQRSYVSKDCPYFKVDVEFEPFGRPSRDGQGRVTLVEDDRDVISKISTPYLQFAITD